MEYINDTVQILEFMLKKAEIIETFLLIVE